MTDFELRIFDVEHGACCIMMSPTKERIAMIDCGNNLSTGWRPSTFIGNTLRRTVLDYLFITNVDQDHLSDLDGLMANGIYVNTLHRNPSPSANVLRNIKETQGKLTNDIERFLELHAKYTSPVSVPFDTGMGGVTCSVHHNSHPSFQDTNNLSLVVFIQYAGITFLFPGDLEKEGWQSLLTDKGFVEDLKRTNILIASHHGRENGFCNDIFRYLSPQVVVISDKSIVHKTQETVPDYKNVVYGDGVSVQNQSRRRHVLTTRRDGDIIFTVSNTGKFWITTTS